MKTLYCVHNIDTCIFSTYEEEKANKFIKIYNDYNLNKFDYYPDKAYIVKIPSTSSPDRIEKEADKVIANYKYFHLVTIFYNKNKDKFFLNKLEKKYLDKLNLWKEELLEYSDEGFKLTFILNDINIIRQTIDNSYFDNNKSNINKEVILNFELIKLIIFTKQRLEESMGGNVLYVIFKKDYECPPRLFKTFSKEKAENFVKEYNRQSKDNNDRVGYFSIHFSNLEKEADEIIKEYLTLKQVVFIEINEKTDNKTLIDKKLKTGELYEDLFLSDNGFTVQLVLEEDCPIDLESKLIRDKIEYLKNKFDFMLN